MEIGYYRKKQLEEDVNDVFSEIKPLIEDRMGISLDDLELRVESSILHNLGTHYNKGVISFMFYLRGSRNRKKIRKTLLHEIGHHYKRVMVDGIENDKENVRVKEGIGSSLEEGFAMYFAQNMFSDVLYSDEEKEKGKTPGKKISFFNSHYYIGYRFFQEVSRELGENAVFEALKNPPKHYAEVYYPELYISRIKGIDTSEEFREKSKELRHKAVCQGLITAPTALSLAYISINLIYAGFCNLSMDMHNMTTMELPLPSMHSLTGIAEQGIGMMFFMLASRIGVKSYFLLRKKEFLL